MRTIVRVQDMRFLSKLEHGVVSGDDLEGIHPDVISRYYGTAGPEKRRGREQTGAGHYNVDDSDDAAAADDSESEGSSSTSDSSESESDSTFDSDDSDSSSASEHDLDDHLAADQERHIRHAPIPVPSSKSPFTNTALEQVFWSSLNEVLEKDIVPGGYGLTEAEWEDGMYSDHECISLGRSGRKVSVALPPQIWWRRAVRWAQGLEILTHVLMIQNGE